jgi:hypothetical protein
MFQAVEKEAAQVAAGAISDMGKGIAADLTKNAGQAATNAEKSVMKEIGGMFKKK